MNAAERVFKSSLMAMVGACIATGEYASVTEALSHEVTWLRRLGMYNAERAAWLADLAAEYA